MAKEEAPKSAAAVSVASPKPSGGGNSVLKNPLLWAGLGMVGLAAGGGAWSADSVYGAMDNYNENVADSSLEDAEALMDQWESNLERHQWVQPVSNAGLIVGASIAAYSVFFGGE